MVICVLLVVVISVLHVLTWESSFEVVSWHLIANRLKKCNCPNLFFPYTLTFKVDSTLLHGEPSCTLSSTQKQLGNISCTHSQKHYPLWSTEITHQITDILPTWFLGIAVLRVATSALVFSSRLSHSADSPGCPAAARLSRQSWLPAQAEGACNKRPFRCCYILCVYIPGILPV